MFNTLMSVGQTQKYVINSSLIFQSLCILFFFFQRGLVVTTRLETSAQAEEVFVHKSSTGSCKGGYIQRGECQRNNNKIELL